VRGKLLILKKWSGRVDLNTDLLVPNHRSKTI
jgi:hypothetical protein